MIRALIQYEDFAFQDILDHFAFYEEQQGLALAERWQLTTYATLRQLALMPQSGGPCFFSSPFLADVRKISVTGFPHLIFYRFDSKNNMVRVVRIIHGARDIEALLSERSAN